MTQSALQQVPCITKTDFQFPGQKGLYRGKVRDVYNIDDRYLVMIATDRISAFDVILPRPIPYKGQVLNQIAVRFLKSCIDICPNWFIESPDPNVTIGLKCEPIRIEMVIRAYLTGHAWRVYKSGKRELCGNILPEGLREHDRLPYPIITPAIKAESGHDEDISKEEILKRGIVTPKEWETLERYTRDLFARGSEMASRRGLLLVDTKYEFGRLNGMLYLMDEVHTPDSSRYFYSEGYEQRQASRQGQKQLSKEFVREWLIAHNFQGLPGQVMPELDDAFVAQVTGRYIELYEKLLGTPFQPAAQGNVLERIEANVLRALERLRSS
ncbi:MAG: phosphoribosylaminoimidazole-succinocarboxamide synthase [Chitinophagales bacterium]|nr:MAG: phosphoribosylaminoimidazole-succinocarboxamide synthase [Chitinophagales bacterium]